MAKKIPMRQCIGCSEMKPKKELLRILRTQEEEIILDTTGRKNGRGAYICPNAECLRQARRTKGIERSFKMAVSEEIYDNLIKEIEIFEAGTR
ncbi:MAG: YlxR family protein [Roseburia sp.]|nr:YlxR family protein [Roseburia sp.]